MWKGIRQRARTAQTVVPGTAIEAKPSQDGAPSATHSGRIVVGDATPRFEVRPATTSHAPSQFRPDAVVDGWECPHFTIRAASVRGDSHRQRGIVRQDDYAISWHEPTGRLIIAVADGVSAAKESQVGASLAVRCCVRWLTQRIHEGVVTIDWDALIQDVAWQIVQCGVRDFAIENGPNRSSDVESVLASTLACMVVDFRDLGRDGPTVNATAVGDSSAWLLRDGKYLPIVGAKAAPLDSCFAGAVTALPRIPRPLPQVTHSVQPDTIVLVGTDGFGDPLGGGEGDVGRFFAANLRTPPPIMEFGRLLDFSRRTFDDDRTLVAVWPKSG